MYIFLFIVGLCLGSFVNALVWRLRAQKDQQKLKTKSPKLNLSILSGRSVCPNCLHELRPIDLIPLVSWLSLRGKCRYCHKPISFQYPLVEMVTAVLFVLSRYYWPHPVHGSEAFLLYVWLIFVTGFVALAVYDIKWYLLPSKILYPLLFVAVLQVIVLGTVYHGGTATFLGAIWGGLIGGGLFYLLYILSGGKWIGGGDVRLGFLLGSLVGGPLTILLLVFVASLLGTIVSLPFLINRKLSRDSLIPFGPFLLASAIVTRLFGAALIMWYKRHLVGG